MEDIDKSDKIKVTFFCQRRTVIIKCSTEDKLNKIFNDFIKEINSNYVSNEFDFYYEGCKLNNDATALKNIIPKDNKIDNINIIAERKLRIIKCPKCICNDCIININDYRIIFYGCKYNHTVYKLFNEYDKSQKADFSHIVCSQEGCNESMNDSFQDFYKCLACTKLLKYTYYLCNNHSSEKEHDKTHVKVRYDDKNYYCETHFNKYKEYCFKCNKNLCSDCLNGHKGHQINNYESLSPNLDEIKANLNKIKEKINDLGIIIASIKKNLDGAMKMYENYYKIANDIVEKYELYNKELKNYRILRSFLNLKKSNQKIIKDLEEIINGKENKDKAYKLMDIYKTDRDIYNNFKSKEILIKEDEYKEWEKEGVIKGINYVITSQNLGKKKEKAKVQNRKNKSVKYYYSNPYIIYKWNH